MKKRIWKEILWAGTTAIGSALFALGFAMFLIPNDINTGGISGLAMILRELLGFGSIGTLTLLMNIPLFLIGGLKIGKRFFGNFNLTIQDDAEVTIGDDCNFGPNTTIVTPCHPMIASERNKIMTPEGEARRLCWAKPVHIGNSCWFGASVTVCPGVTIGDNCVIGAGSVVTRDIPPNSFAAGVPCRVIREITDADSMKHKPEILADNKVIE